VSQGRFAMTPFDALVDQLASAVADAVAARLPAVETPAIDGWLNTKSAAEHLDCPPSRIHDLVQQRQLTPEHDGTRLLFRRSWLDAYVEGGTA